VHKFFFHHAKAILHITGWLGVLIIGIPLAGCNTSPGNDGGQLQHSRGDTSIVSGPASNQSADLDSSSAVTVYYFHRTVRCHGCQQIELMADQTIRQRFSKELEQGRLIWLVLDMDEPENQPFVKEYDLSVSTLVLANARKKGSRDWKKLEKVWELYGDPEAFNQYVRKEIAEYLTGEKK
jgi:hypothetical protein